MSGYELPARDLAACGRDGCTGEVRVSGSPGGTVHLRGGLVVAVESPGPNALMLRSGRIGGEECAALVRESGGARRPPGSSRTAAREPPSSGSSARRP
ncbi:hypothetical protein [Streptomyces sp. NPDC052015]|uniref:hypothetical protein n=1 Tax=Streptomyces sp. NPDC052015 TaxID=3154755 RepID=UPI00344781E7